ncbi:winged helix-turn-helix domain-containing protein [Modicisalibacter luteus]|uniref:Winged helix-turn-helix domain-containing protein n=1 Tax=Modicisalibacter luteus TaxID=453962 RepID=A0ABV7M0C2_9GAMM|nr:response regulator transcription factor [Halomonas lutea]
MGNCLNSENKDRVLIVEDDERLATLTQEYLEANGYRVIVEADGALAVERIIELQPGIVILDLMLPGADGLSICRRVKPYYAGPILILTARADDVDQVLGLEMGADDYLPKPVQPRVLLAHMHALMRRKDSAVRKSKPVLLNFGGLMINRTVREAWLDGERIDLSCSEFDLLWLLANNAGRVLTREEIFSSIRGTPYNGQDRGIDVRVSRIRPKIGDDPNQPHLIKTVRNRGYMFVKRA